MSSELQHRVASCVHIATLAAALSLTVTASALERFDGRISRPDLERYLSRAITMEGLLQEHGNLEDEIRFLHDTGARFAGRTIYLWGGERNLELSLQKAHSRERRVHEVLPELILPAAIFEIVTEDVSLLPVPAGVAREFGVTNQPRKFSYENMLYADGKRRNQWRRGASVPDLSQTEAQMWFYYLATRYIDLGVEAIHFGQVGLMDARDRDHRAWDSVLSRVRAYARSRARRGLVLCDAHVPTGGIRVGERLLLDFHSFPLRIDEVPEHPLEGRLRMGYRDSLYGRSKGGVTPSGWSCEHLPYLVEFDNFGRSRREGRHIGGFWVWGYDEISWFAHMTGPERDHWLRYAWEWVREHDPNGYVEMPGSRTLAVPAEKRDWYWASMPGPGCPTGFGDETAIRDIWTAAPGIKGQGENLK